MSKKTSNKLVESQVLLPLLDGFDEIKASFRNSFLSELNKYLQKVKNRRKLTFPEVILCSRTKEYKNSSDAPVFASIIISRLKKKTTKTELRRLSKKLNFVAANRIRETLKSKPELYKAISTVFYLHLLLDMAQVARLKLKNSSKKLLQDEILELYISTEILKLPNKNEIKKKKYLGWLAWQSRYRLNSLSFELINLQPDTSKGWYSLLVISTFSTGFLFTVFYALVFFPILNYAELIIYSLTAGLTAGFFCYAGLILSDFISQPKIRTDEITILNFNNIDFKLLLRCLFYAAGSTLAIVIVLAFLLKMYDVIFTYKFFISILTFTFFDLLITKSTSKIGFPRTKHPYKKFLAQLRQDFLKYFFLISIAFTMMLYDKSDPKTSLLVAICFSFLFTSFSVVALNPLVFHMYVRGNLAIHGTIPFRLVSFLNSVTSNTGLMVKNGGKWSFRHQLIRDNLADWFEFNYYELLTEDDLSERES